MNCQKVKLIEVETVSQSTDPRTSSRREIFSGFMTHGELGLSVARGFHIGEFIRAFFLGDVVKADSDL
jgi:hypothetical protein